MTEIPVHTKYFVSLKVAADALGVHWTDFPFSKDIAEEKYWPLSLEVWYVESLYVKRFAATNVLRQRNYHNELNLVLALRDQGYKGEVVLYFNKEDDGE